jgi:hypothetical protein
VERLVALAVVWAIGCVVYLAATRPIRRNAILVAGGLAGSAGLVVWAADDAATSVAINLALISGGMVVRGLDRSSSRQHPSAVVDHRSTLREL